MEQKLGVRLRWLSSACYEIECGDTHIVTDPHITVCTGTDLTHEVIEQCDMILLTHNHWDHITDLPTLTQRFDPLLLCPEQSMVPLAKWLNLNPSRVYPMYPDVELNFGDVKIRPLFGRHINLKMTHGALCDALDRNPVNQKVPGMIDVQHIGNLDYRAYLLTLKNGIKILYWGSNLAKEQLPLCKPLKPDIAIIQRAVNPWGIARKADFSAALGAKVVLPHHQEHRFNTFPEAVPLFEKEYLARVPGGCFINPRHGEWMEL